MIHALLLSVRFYDGRYHGAGDWPPAPARLYQALISGNAKGKTLEEKNKEALEWLEKLDAPLILTPTVKEGQPFSNSVPNNDRDLVEKGSKPANKIRTMKPICPYIFDAEIPLVFIWKFNTGVDSDDYAQTLCKLAERLYQLGRGVDMAWAWAELVDANEIELRIARHGGTLYRPSGNGPGLQLFCPQEGSCKSLEARFKESLSRITPIKKGEVLFSRLPEPRFAKVTYNVPWRRYLFELRTTNQDAGFVAWSVTRTAELIVNLRDKAIARLKKHLRDKDEEIEHTLKGRLKATETDKTIRTRILPLPSIGHSHADLAIRRLLVEIPPKCPLRADDIIWAFAGLEKIDPATGEILWHLVRAEDDRMLRHYGIDDGIDDDKWRTVTPVVLPFMKARRRAPGNQLRRVKANAASAVEQALRYAEVRGKVKSIRVQREPFDQKGTRAGDFAQNRFSAPSLHHVELSFESPVQGPLVIGNGRYFGLGLMAPCREIPNTGI